MLQVGERLQTKRFRAMGTVVEAFAVRAAPSVLAGAEAEIAALERRWSRFIDSSEISRLNRNGGRPAVVSEETFMLVSLALDGWYLTDGLFDPTILDALIAAGYDRSFELLSDEPNGEDEDPALPRGTGGTRPTAEEIVLDPYVQAVMLPSGLSFDPGGIGKGLAADLVVGSMLGAGATGACVNLGGDLRAEGEPPGPEGWIVAVEDPFGGEPRHRVALRSGAIATSTTTRRVWRKDGEVRHHLIDPATRRPAETAIVSATVVAPEGWLAEVLAKTALLTTPPESFDLIASRDATGLVVEADGTVHLAPGMSDLLA